MLIYFWVGFGFVCYCVVCCYLTMLRFFSRLVFGIVPVFGWFNFVCGLVCLQIVWWLWVWTCLCLLCWLWLIACCFCLILMPFEHRLFSWLDLVFVCYWLDFPLVWLIAPCLFAYAYCLFTVCFYYVCVVVCCRLLM